MDLVEESIPALFVTNVDRDLGVAPLHMDAEKGKVQFIKHDDQGFVFGGFSLHIHVAEDVARLPGLERIAVAALKIRRQ